MYIRNGNFVEATISYFYCWFYFVFMYDLFSLFGWD